MEEVSFSVDMDETMDQETRGILEALDACQTVIGTRLDEEIEMIDLYARDAEEQMRGVEHEVRECKEAADKVSTDLSGKIDNLQTQAAEVSNELKSATRMLTQVLNLLHQGPARINKLEKKLGDN
eukprot:g14026.t1